MIKNGCNFGMIGIDSQIAMPVINFYISVVVKILIHHEGVYPLAHQNIIGRHKHIFDAWS